MIQTTSSDDNRKELSKIGVIHGRFQILHNDHMKYLMAGKARCRNLVVGITNPDPTLTKTETADPMRSNPAANPLTYFERYQMVRLALTEQGVPSETISIVPFPVNIPALYRYYVPLNATFFLTIYDDWGRQKLRYFNSLGLSTEVLWDIPAAEKGIEAGDIRKRIQQGLPWHHLVPPVVAGLIEGWDIKNRLDNASG